MEDANDELPDAAELGVTGATGTAGDIELSVAAVVETIDEGADELTEAAVVTLVDKATDELIEETLVIAVDDATDELLAPPIEGSDRLTLSDDDNGKLAPAEVDSSSVDERTPAVRISKALQTSERLLPKGHVGR
ncbi:hypothetical protein BD311DRAFT_212300 [Dichomitus squalens]|uniref:Uncharacterized protein n=1 Tax=Dichomitus squalens TaxID=114155 RepID=A0A4Q9N3Y3_9APHY|nr:hypothetical protein BD311DRAFT_212300 [Dichomitus squalens]